MNTQPEVNYTHREAYIGNHSRGEIFQIEGSSLWRASLLLDGKRKHAMYGTESKERLIKGLDNIDKKHGETLQLMKSHRDVAEDRRRENMEAMKGKIVPGTLLHGSWGYEQTQCELFQVVSVKGTIATVRRVETRNEICGNGMAANVYPMMDKFSGPEIKLKISSHGCRYKKLCTLVPSDWDRSFYRSWYG